MEKYHVKSLIYEPGLFSREVVDTVSSSIVLSIVLAYLLQWLLVLSFMGGFLLLFVQK